MIAKGVTVEQVAKVNDNFNRAGIMVHAYLMYGFPTQTAQETIDSLNRTRVALKGPLETPVGFGEKSANVTLRKLFETFANIRPVR